MLAKDVCNIPSLRFPEFSGDWGLKTFSTFLKERVEFPVEEHPLYSLTIEGGVVPKTARYERAFLVKSKDKAYKVMHQYDFAYNPMNLRFGALAMHKEKKKVLVSKYYDIFYCNDDVVSSYVESYFTTYKMIQFYNKMATGSLEEKKRLHYSDFVHFKKPFPSKAEQQKIADFLTAVDKRIQQLEEKKRLLTKYKKGVMQKIFSQQIRFKDDSGNPYPDWEEKRGNDVFASVSNKKHNSGLPILAITQEHGAIPRGLIDYKVVVSESSIASYKVVEVGDFIISLRSFQGGIEYSDYQGICSPAYIILKPTIEISAHFYKVYFKTFNYIQELNRKLEGIRDGKMISYKYFSEIKLPYPSIPEQQKIADFFTSIDTKIEQVSSQLEQAKAFKQGLLQQMFV